MTTLDSVEVTTLKAFKFILGNVVLIPQTVIIEFTGEIPDTWGNLGFVYREIQIDEQWVLVESGRLIPNRPNLFTWNDNAPYRLAFKLVRYVKPGQLVVKDLS